MLTIRMSRFGRKGLPMFRLIINEKTKDPWGDYLDALGWYNPRTKEKSLEVEKIKKYIANGAQVSDSVRNLLISEGVIEGKKANVTRITNRRRAKMDAVVKKAADEKEKAEADRKAKEEAAKAEAEAAKAATAEAPVADETPAA